MIFPSSVFIDTIAPTIELDGDADYTVYVGDSQLYHSWRYCI